jgi:hypothetical protein
MKAVWLLLLIGALAAAACRFGGPTGDPSMLIDLPPSDAATEASDGPMDDATGDEAAEATGVPDATPDQATGVPDATPDQATGAPDATPDGAGD